MNNKSADFDKTVECPCCMALGSLYQTEACYHSHVAKVEDEVDGNAVWKCVSCGSVFTEAFRTRCLRYYFDHEFYFSYYTHCCKICCCANCRYRNRQECTENKEDYCCPLWATDQEAQDEICGKPNPTCPECGGEMQRYLRTHEGITLLLWECDDCKACPIYLRERVR